MQRQQCGAASSREPSAAWLPGWFSSAIAPHLMQSSEKSSMSLLLVYGSSANEWCWHPLGPDPRALLIHSLVYRLKASIPPQLTLAAPGHFMLQAVLAPRACAKVAFLPAQHSTPYCR